MNQLFTLVFLTLLFIKPAFSQTKDAISQELTDSLKKIYSQGDIVGFSVAVVNQEGILYARGFGYADAKEKISYTENTVQNIASISKTTIGIALLKAQELGKLKLDNPVNDYLPFQVVNPYFPDEPITIRHLATHTSSIQDPARYEQSGYILMEKENPNTEVPGNFRSPDEMMPMEDFLENNLSATGKWYEEKNYLERKPGEKFEYSNIAASLAAYVIELATGQTYPDFTRRYIFESLNMNNTGWSFSEIDFSKRTKLYHDSETELAMYTLITYPDGGLITSSSDLGKYLSELINGFNGNGTILGKESYQELFNPQLTEKNFEKRSDHPYNDEYNMGIFMGFSSKGNIGHTGGDPGVATFMFFNDKNLIGKILIVNTELDDKGISEFSEVWTMLEKYEGSLNRQSK